MGTLMCAKCGYADAESVAGQGCPFCGSMVVDIGILREQDAADGECPYAFFSEPESDPA